MWWWNPSRHTAGSLPLHSFSLDPHRLASISFVTHIHPPQTQGHLGRELTGEPCLPRTRASAVSQISSRISRR